MNYRTEKYSRRQFFQQVGVSVAGAALASIPLVTSCQSAGNTAAVGDSSADNTTPPASSAPDGTTATMKSSASTAPVTPVPSMTTYVPPSTPPPLLRVLNSPCEVASDRAYSIDHIWVKTLSTGLVALGVSSTMVELIFIPYKLTLEKVGSPLSRHDPFGAIEGYKMNADLSSPVSGRVLQVNDSLVNYADQGKGLEPLIKDPYNAGWMMVVQLSQPDELKSLLSAENYRDSISVVGDK
jgi:glycine cleavage system H protein